MVDRQKPAEKGSETDFNKYLANKRRTSERPRWLSIDGILGEAEAAEQGRASDDGPNV